MPSQDTKSRSAIQPRKAPDNSEQSALKRELTFSISLQRLRDSVENGWLVSFSQMTGDIVTGYLAGLDREYFVVFVPADDGEGNPRHREFLLSRGLNAGVEIHEENTFEDEPSHPSMVERVEAFRKWILRANPKSPATPVQTGPPGTGRPAQRDMPRNWKPQPGTEDAGPSHPMFSSGR